MDTKEEIGQIERDWNENPRWAGVQRPYSAADVARLRGTKRIEQTLARDGAEKLWHLMNETPYVNALGALTGNQAMQQVKAGLKAIYLSGWQVAGDANLAGEMYPDQSLYPANSVPAVVERINNTLRRADELHHAEGDDSIDWYAPIVADAEAGFGGPLNAFELMKGMIKAGAAGVHFEDQLASAKKCGHMGGKVLVPTQEQIQKLTSARLAADVMGVPTVIVARTDAEDANLLTTDIDPADQPFITGERTFEGYYRVTGGIDACITRALAYAPYCDVIWCETKTPDLEFARQFAEGVHEKFPARCWPITARPHSIGPRSWMPRRSASSRTNSVRWASSSSSSRSRASTPSTTACSVSPMATAIGRWRPMWSSSRKSSRPRPRGTRRLATSARSAPGTSIPSATS
jgi:isocitrate lyase